MAGASPGITRIANHSSHIAGSNGGVTVVAIRNGRNDMHNQQQTNSHETQMSLLDVLAARDKAIDRVEDNADSEWKSVAYVTAVETASSREFFTSSDIWDAISDVTTHEPRAMGAVRRRLRKENIVEPTDRFVTSSSPLAHGRPSRVWRSMIVGEQRTLENNDRQPATHHDSHVWE